MRFALIAVLALAACNTTGSQCNRYIRAQNQCSNELSDAGFAVLDPLSSSLVCATLNLPGIANEDTRDEFACLADAYENADCSSEEAFNATFDTTCEGGDSDLLDTE